MPGSVALYGCFGENCRFSAVVLFYGFIRLSVRSFYISIDIGRSIPVSEF